MPAIKSILVDIDPTKKQQPALVRALQFAHKQQITIKLLSCLYYPSVVANNFLTPKQLENTKATIIEMNQKQLYKLIEQHQTANVNFESEVIWHSPVYQGILNVIDSFKPDLVIKSTHQHLKPAKRLFTPMDWQLLKSCPTPILLVKHADWSANSKIVAAVDPNHNLSKTSGLDTCILQTAQGVAKQLNSPHHAVHCFDPSYWDILLDTINISGMWGDVFPANNAQDESKLIADIRYEQNQKFSQTCSEYVPNSANQHLIDGEIETVLPDKLKQLEAGILVLGTTYRSGLIGSTAERLLEIVECDVLGVKAEGFKS